MNQILDFNEEEEKEIIKQPKPNNIKSNNIKPDNTQVNSKVEVQNVRYKETAMPEVPQFNTPQFNAAEYNGYNNVKNNGQNKGGAKVLIKVFTIIMILFAISLGTYATYKLIQNRKLKERNDVLNPQENIKINIEEINGKIRFSVNSKNEIDRVVYSWNNDVEKEQLIKGEGKHEIVQENIDIPKGDNRFKVSVIDKKGEKSFLEKDFKQAKGNDIQKPTINFKLNGNLIELDIQDDIELQDVKYRWEDEAEEKTAVPPTDNKKQLKLQFTTKEGERVLKITATDTSGNSETVRKNFVGLSAPKIKLSQTGDKTSLEIEVEHQSGISKVEYSINGKQYKREYRKDDPNNKKVLITQMLDVGDNVIQVRAQSVEGVDTPLETGNANRPPQTQRPAVQPPSGIQPLPNVRQDGSVAPQLPNLVTR